MGVGWRNPPLSSRDVPSFCLMGWALVSFWSSNKNDVHAQRSSYFMIFCAMQQVITEAVTIISNPYRTKIWTWFQSLNQDQKLTEISSNFRRNFVESSKIFRILPDATFRRNACMECQWQRFSSHRSTTLAAGDGRYALALRPLPVLAGFSRHKWEQPSRSMNLLFLIRIIC